MDRFTCLEKKATEAGAARLVPGSFALISGHPAKKSEDVQLAIGPG
jgi:hypothetical protein